MPLNDRAQSVKANGPCRWHMNRPRGREYPDRCLVHSIHSRPEELLFFVDYLFEAASECLHGKRFRHDVHAWLQLPFADNRVFGIARDE